MFVPQSRKRTWAKLGAGLGCAACVVLLLMSAFGRVQESADRIH
jgi:hypothetical protein